MSQLSQSSQVLTLPVLLKIQSDVNTFRNKPKLKNEPRLILKIRKKWDFRVSRPLTLYAHMDFLQVPGNSATPPGIRYCNKNNKCITTRNYVKIRVYIFATHKYTCSAYA